MYFLYSLLLAAWGVLLIPAFLYKAWRRNQRLPGLGQRLGRLPEALKHDGRFTIWFHACSVGETLSLRPLVRLFHKKYPETRFVFSTVTATGQEVAVRSFSACGQGSAFYFPLDFASIVRRVFDRIRPSLLIIVDTEIWPNTVHEAHRRGIPVALVNGRISASSFRYYRWAKPVLKRVFQNYRLLMMQSEEDAGRIRALGAPAGKVAVTGNMKYDWDAAGANAEEKAEDALERAFGLEKGNAALIVAGSTHPGEEDILLEAFGKIRRSPDLGTIRLMLAPRHPERFDEVARLAARKGFSVRRRTDRSSGMEDAPGILLLDSLGELETAYRFATIVFVGGTLIRHGGHSILEPARFSKAIVIGPYMDNFRQIAEEFRKCGGLCPIAAGETNRSLQVQQLMEIFSRLLHNSREREDLGRAAFSILERNRGAAERAMQKIAAIYEEQTAQSVSNEN